jgi:hypothetical protein
MEAPPSHSEDPFVRTRSTLAALSLIVVSGFVLAGCSGGSGDPTPTASDPASADLCTATAPAGEASDAVKVEGTVGEPSTAEFTAPLEVGDALERSLVSEGDGDAIAAGDWVSFAFSVFSGETGEKLADLGYGDSPLLPQQISAESVLGNVIGCATAGSRFVAAFPPSGENAAEIYVFDVLDIVPTAAWGEPQEPEAGFPTVTLADDGQPSVEIPAGDPPTDVQIEVLKKGDGPTIAAGDTTLLQYYGVDWETGESFDSSWSKGAPYSNQGNQYVPGFQQALEGQTVGSQVLVVIPPAEGYGEAGTSDHELAGKTLVFVIDILATQHGQ